MGIKVGVMIEAISGLDLRIKIWKIEIRVPILLVRTPKRLPVSVLFTVLGGFR